MTSSEVSNSSYYTGA